jgi:predicted RNase H-like HicB family nuclease
MILAIPAALLAPARRQGIISRRKYHSLHNGKSRTRPDEVEFVHRKICAGCRRLARVINSHLQFSSSLGVLTVEHMIQLHIERLPEGGYLATSDEVQGLVAQGRTIQETIEIARDVAKKLIEVQSESRAVSLPPVREVFDYPLIVGT